MTGRFVDTHYLLALVNPGDADHGRALQHSQGAYERLVTTTWVLVEFADALSSVSSRGRAARFIRGFKSQPYVEVVAPTQEQFEGALELYEQRPDKEWSLTDCISFRLMQSRGLIEALTADRHFEQAGFRAVLRD